MDGPTRLLRRDAEVIRVAVAGLGKMGGYHVRALLSLGAGEAEPYDKDGLGEQVAKVRLCGLCDPRGDERYELAPGVPRYTNWCELEARLAHASGVEGTLFVSWLVPPEERRRREIHMTMDGGGAVFGDLADKRLLVDGEPVSCVVPSWVRPDNNQVKDELADFIGHCLEPMPGGGSIEPLLSRREIAASVGIIEDLSERVSHPPPA